MSRPFPTCAYLGHRYQGVGAFILLYISLLPKLGLAVLLLLWGLYLLYFGNGVKTECVSEQNENIDQIMVYII